MNCRSQSQEKNLYEKVWQDHELSVLPNGYSQLFIDLHLIHGVTSPQAFAMLEEKNIPVLYPERTIATVDHIIPTKDIARPYKDILARK